MEKYVKLDDAFQAPRVTPEGVVTRLAAARKPMDSTDVLLAFDADGTLWRGDVGNDVFEALLEASAVRDEAHEALVAEAKAHGISPHGGPTDVARALYAAHVAGTYPEDRAFAMMAWAFAGFSVDEARRFSQQVLATTKLEDRLHRFLEPIFAWALGENVAVWVVSASAKWIVEIGVATFGILKEHVIGMTPRVRDGFIEPTLDGPPIYGPNKPLVLKSACPNGTLLGAFGDSKYDGPLLAAASVPVAVRPKPALMALVTEIPALVIVGT